MWLGKEECNVTWENENAIPQSVLQEFEDDSLVEVEKLSTERIGQTSHTLCVNASDNKARLQRKKIKRDRIVVSCNDGYVHTLQACVYTTSCCISRSNCKVNCMYCRIVRWGFRAQITRKYEIKTIQILPIMYLKHILTAHELNTVL